MRTINATVFGKDKVVRFWIKTFGGNFFYQLYNLQ